MVISSYGPTSFATPASRVVPSSISFPQQPHLVFRQAVGDMYLIINQAFSHIIRCISPLYVPPRVLHHFMGDVAFPQASTWKHASTSKFSCCAPFKYQASAYKPGANTESQTYAVASGAFGTYTQSVYPNNNMVPSGTLAENVSGSQFKENNIYIAGQQSYRRNSRCNARGILLVYPYVAMLHVRLFVCKLASAISVLKFGVPISSHPKFMGCQLRM